MESDEDKNEIYAPNVIDSFGLQPEIVSYYKKKGIVQLFLWQVECLRLPGILSAERNLVYTAPTSAGKSMVADILIYETALVRKKKTIIILPFVSIAIEKVQSMQELCRSLSIRIGSFAADYNPIGGIDRVEIAVCTIEKANTLINKLIEDNRLNEIGLVVIDELHMLGDSGRGYLLELLLTKIIFQCNSDRVKGLQIIGMSATIPNLNDIANWLNAQCYQTDYRPVLLQQKIICKNRIFSIEGYKTLEKGVVQCEDLSIKPPNESVLVYSAIEPLLDGHSVLVFCPTKFETENVAKIIAENIFELGGKRKPITNERISTIGQKLVEQIDQTKICQLIENLKRSITGLDNSLSCSIRFGVAFHHAGLSIEERSILENAFRNGIIRILCSTTTLSAGVNLPARRVIITSPFDYRKAILNPMVYRQMVGRAGRMGIDDLGESMLLCKSSKDFEQFVSLVISGSLKPIKSCLTSSNVHLSPCLKRALLEVISNGLVNNYNDLASYIRCTFLQNSQPEISAEMLSIIEQVFQYLIQNKLIYVANSKLIISSLGKAIVMSGFDPDDGLFIHDELYRAMTNFNLKNPLHLIYQATPTNIADQMEQKIRWHHYYDFIWNNLSDEYRNVASLVGIEERKLFNWSKNLLLNEESNIKERRVYQRFYVALALSELVQEKPLLDVAQRYKLSRGMIQSLQHRTNTIETYFGVKRDLLDLMRIPTITSTIARQLFVKDINPFDKNDPSCSKNGDPGSTRIYLPFLDRRVTIRELSRIIVDDARRIVEEEIGTKLYFGSQKTCSLNNLLQYNETKQNEIDNNHEQQQQQQQKQSEQSPIIIHSDDSWYDETNYDIDTPKAKRQKLEQDVSLSSNKSIEFKSSFNNSPFIDLLTLHEKCFESLPPWFEESMTTTIKANNFQLISIETSLQLEQMLTEIFGNSFEKVNDSHIIDLAIHFQLLTIPQSTFTQIKKRKQLQKNEPSTSCTLINQDFRIDDCYPMELQNLYFYRFGQAKVFHLNSIEVFHLLCSRLPEIFKVHRLRLLTYDMKELLYILQYGFKVPINILLNQVQWYDLSVAIWLLNPEAGTFNITKLNINDLIKQTIQYGISGQKYFQEIHKHSNTSYAGENLLKVSTLFHLMGQYCQRLRIDNLLPAFQHIEVPARLTIYLMQTRGITIDYDRLSQEQTRISSFLTKLEYEIYSQVGVKFNLNSPKEVAHVVYDKMDLISFYQIKKSSESIKHNDKTIRKKPNTSRSTSKTALIKLQAVCGNNLPLSIIEWRRLNHSLNQCIIPIRNAIFFQENETKLSAKSFLYCRCDEWSATGRISMYEPNLINVNKDFDITCPAIDENENVKSIRLRSLICPRENYTLISADYCQLELRILAHFTSDPTLMETLNDTKNDVFKSIASKWKGIPIDQVDYEQRQAAKQICYGIIYGMGNRTLAENLAVTEQTAIEFRQSFLERYNRLEPFINDVIERCEQNGYVETISHRRRQLPNIKSFDNEVKSRAKRQAVNTSIQGSAADIIKLSMIAVNQSIQREQFDAHLLMQMHDELMYEVRTDNSERPPIEFAKLLQQQMENVSKHLQVMLPVKIYMGPNWADLKQIMDL
ncbi:hypothetical protein RDWZM_007309 [Blomia tropicalis]|uniref:DNA-directed DNA polymerase n=1 Tax=Blomia tropicalis TaxID=40697 RepID=A0A9Q0M2D6_BLOTA|nr:hypothetical protein RDWZM_007309 [Blomia tropicalis]